MKKRLLFQCFSIFLLSLFICSSVYAQEQVTDSYTLGEVVVKAEKEGVEAIGTVREIKFSVLIDKSRDHAKERDEVSI